MEKHVSLAWRQGLEFTALSEDGVAVELGGAESVDTFRPAAMLLVALGGCTGMDAISIMLKKRLTVSSYRVLVQGIQRDEHPKVYTSIGVEHVVEGTALDDGAVARAVELSARRYCAVGATIAQGETTIEHRIRVIDERGERSRACLVIGPRGQGLDSVEASVAAATA